jgi:muramoyltetrapeptide carboxypeptidase
MPDLEGALLVLEDDEEILPVHVDRSLQSLIHQPGFEGVRALVLGRFQRASEMEPDTIKAIVESKRELAGVPVVANASFGHTTPQFTFPIGGYGRVRRRWGRETTDRRALAPSGSDHLAGSRSIDSVGYSAFQASKPPSRAVAS